MSGEILVPIAITCILFVFCIAVAYREFQRGDMLLAAVFALVGIALAVYRLRARNKS